MLALLILATAMSRPATPPAWFLEFEPHGRVVATQAPMPGDLRTVALHRTARTGGRT